MGRKLLAEVGPWALAVGLLLVVTPLLGRFYLHLAVTVLTMALFAMSYNLLLGEAGLVSFGHAAFFGVGGYTYALLATKTELPLPFNLVLSPIVSGLVALGVGYFCVRLHGILFSMLTLAFGQVLYTIVFQWYSFTGGDNGIVGLPAPAGLRPLRNHYVFVVLAVGASAYVLLRIRGSPFGQALRLMRENRERAQFIGIEVQRYRLAVFALAGFFAGLAGLLFALLNRQVFPDTMHWAQTAEVLVMTLLGGIFTFFGPAVGAALVTVLRTWIGTYTIYWMLILGLVLLLCVLFFPHGIVGHARGWLPQLPRLEAGRRAGGGSRG